MARAPTFAMRQILAFLASPAGGAASGASISRGTRLGSEDLYPALSALEFDGLISSAWAEEPSPRRRLYSLTEDGRAQIGTMPPAQAARQGAGNWFWQRFVAPFFGG